MHAAVKPRFFILDVDGVLTNGQFIYSTEGKVLKTFGPDDNDALSLLSKHLEIRFISADRRGFPISKKRVVEDMGYKLDLVSSKDRIKWIEEKYPIEQVIYMADGIFDHYVMKKVCYSIAPANASSIAKKHADFVTERSGGDRAVSEACLHILERFFDAFDANYGC